MNILSFIYDLVLRLPLWAIFSLPLFGLMWFIAKKLKSKDWPQGLKTLSFGFVAAVFLAPMPMGMFLVLLPNGYLMFSGISYYKIVWPWLAVSIPTTFIIASLIFSKYAKNT